MTKASYFGTDKEPEALGVDLVRAVDKAADQAGFISREPVATMPKRRRQPVNEPTFSFTARISLRSGNRFIEWCEHERISYRQGFDRLIEMLPE